MATRRVFTVRQAPRTGQLTVSVVDDRGEPVAGAYVSVYPPGAGVETDAEGRAVFDTLPPGTLEVGALKAGHGPDREGSEGRVAQETGLDAGQQLTVTLTLQRLPVVLTENIVLVGSERYYNSFGLKMMFIAPAFAMVSRGIELRPADRTTILFVDDGYTRHEKLALEYLSTERGVKVVPFKSAAAIVAHFNARPQAEIDGRPTRTLVQDVAIFCHGFPNRLALNLSRLPSASIDVGPAELGAIAADVFVPDGRIFSYACRTGVGKNGEDFADDSAAEPENSLAQKLADHFGVEVHAFLTRTWYGEVLAARGELDDLAETLEQARGGAAGGVVELPPLHEALPHPGIGGVRAWWEGTKDHVLWRKPGAIAMPYGHDTPAGLSSSRQRFLPYQ